MVEFIDRIDAAGHWRFLHRAIGWISHSKTRASSATDDRARLIDSRQQERIADSAGFDEIGGTGKKFFQGFGEAEELFKRVEPASGVRVTSKSASLVPGSKSAPRAAELVSPFFAARR